MSANQMITVTAARQSPTARPRPGGGSRAEGGNHCGARALEIVGDDDLNRQTTRRVVCFCCFAHLPSVAVSAVGRGGSFVYDRAMPEPSVTPDDVRRAAGVIRGAVHRTPTFTSRSLGPGRYLKAELFQRTGSFKARGALNRLERSRRRSATPA